MSGSQTLEQIPAYPGTMDMDMESMDLDMEWTWMGIRSFCTKERTDILLKEVKGY
jgi:hypothetical protein